MTTRKLKRSLFFKTISMVLVFAFASYNISFAVTAENTGTPAVTDIVSVPAPLSVADIGINIDCGTIKSKYTGNTGKTIVHIQDAHCNYEAQSNINQMLGQLTRELGINMISVEGAEGIVDTAWFRAFPDAEIRKEVATYFMKKGEITGAEFFSIISDYSGIIFGAETRDYYIKNLRAFTEVYQYKTMIEDYFTGMLTIANRLKSMVYSPKLKKLDSKTRAFEAKDVELSAYADYLNKLALSLKVDVGDCVNFKQLLQTLEYEDKIDFDTVDQERSRYIDAVSKTLSKEKMAALVAESIKFKKGHIKAVDFYFYLRQIAKEQDIQIVHEYPNLFYYYLYTKLYDGIDNEKLFKEIDIVKTRLKERLFQNKEQEKLDKFSDMIEMFISMVNIELTNEDYDLFKTYSDEFTLEDVGKFIEKLCGRYGLDPTVKSMPAQISDQIPNMIAFYEIAMKRDNALIDNTLKKMEDAGKDRCVLIAGGFHTRGIRNILEKKGISYVVVTPKITKDVETPYIKVLTNQRTSLEDIITESAAVPGVGVASVHENAAAAKGDFLAPFLRFNAVNLLLDAGEKASLKKLSENIGQIPDENARTILGVAVDTFEEAVTMIAEKWVEKAKKEMSEKDKLSDREIGAEWSKILADDHLWKRLLSAYLDEYRTNWLKIKSDAAGLDRIEESIAQAFGVFRKKELSHESTTGMPADVQPAASGDTPGKQGGDAEEGILTASQAKKYGEIIREYHSPENIKANLASGAVKIIERKDIRDEIRIPIGTAKSGEPQFLYRPAFQFVVYRGLAKRLKAEGLPVYVHPGRGGDVMGHDLLQAHIDEKLYESLTDEELKVLALHELAHLDIYYVEELYRAATASLEISGTTGERNMSFEEEKAFLGKIEQRVGTDAYGHWEKWAHSLNPRPTGAAQERFVNEVLGYDVRGLLVDKALKNKLRNLKELRTEVVEKNKGADVILAITNGGDGSVVKEALKSVRSIFNKTKKADILTHEETSRRGQWLGLLDAMAGSVAGWKEKGAVVLGVMLPGKGTRLSPLTQRLHGIKPFFKVPVSVVKVKKDSAWLSAAEASLYTWNLVAFHLKRMGFKGIAWKWGDEPQISSNLLSKLNMDLSKTDIIRFGSETLVTEDMASNKEWLSANPDGSLKAQVRRRGRKELLERLGIKDTPDAKAMVHLGSPAFSYIFIEEAQKIFGAQKGWMDVDGYLVEALTQDKDMWDREYDKEVYTAVKGFVKKYFGPGAEIDKEKISNLLFVEKIRYKENKEKEELERAGMKRRVKPLIEKALNELKKEGSVSEVNGTYFADSGEYDPVKDGPLEELEFSEPGIHELLRMHPKFYEDCQRLKTNVEKKRKGKLQIKVIDFGPDLYWGDVGQLSRARQGYSILTEDGPEADFAREIAMIDDAPVDKFGNRIVGTCVYPGDGSVRNSVLINTKIYGEAADVSIDKAVLVGSIVEKATIGKGSVVYGSTVRTLVMGDRAFSFESISSDRLEIKDDYVHTSIPKDSKDLTKGFEDWWAIGTPEWNPGKKQNYKVPVLGNPRSYEEQTGIARQRKVSIKKIEADIQEQSLNAIDRYLYFKNTAKKIKFGTSGLRDTVENMPDMEVYINARGFVEYLIEAKDIERGATIFVAGDLRPSTPRLMKAVGKAIEDAECKVEFGGFVPSPAVSYFGSVLNNKASVMVTGSHIPVDRNGIKFNKSSGEVLKADEQGILDNVAVVRDKVYGESWKDSEFDEKGMFKDVPGYDLTAKQREMSDQFVQRYTDAFPKDALDGKKVFLYQHSAVGRDLVKKVFEALGAEVIAPGMDDSENSIKITYIDEKTDREMKETVDLRSAVFVPVDTEKISNKTKAILRYIAERYKPDVIISTDGDSDRPLLADENGNFLAGDKLGGLVSLFIKPNFAAIPVSTVDGVVNMLKIQKDMKKVVLTKIGSPHVIKGMNDWLAKTGHENDIVVGWEANGGFLVGSKVTIPGGGELAGLATRDAILPLIAVIMLAKNENMTVSQLIKARVSDRYNAAGVFDRFKERFGVEGDVAFDLMKTTKESILPHLEDKAVVSVDFDKKKVFYLVDGSFEVRSKDLSALSVSDRKAWSDIKDLLDGVFSAEGFKPISSINILDGVKIVFENKEVSHLRPSGNAPEFRNYATAHTQERADKIVSIGINKIIPALLQKVMAVDSGNAELTGVDLTPGIYAAPLVPEDVDNEQAGNFKEAMEVFARAVEEKRPIKIVPHLTTGLQGYSWGQAAKDSFILKMGGVSSEAKIIAERWINAGDGVEVTLANGKKYVLPISVMSLFADNIFGAEHAGKHGAKSPITPKILTSSRPLSLQMHSFPEMITPFENGYAWIGFQEDVTAERVADACIKGTVQDLLNGVKVKAGVPLMIPAYMPHAYGKMIGYEVKAVTSAEDAVGTIAFYDRLKFLDPNVAKEFGVTKLVMTKSKLAAINGERLKKDLLTMTDEQAANARRFLSIAEDRGTLKAVDMTGILLDPTKTAHGDVGRYEELGRLKDRFVSGRYIFKRTGSITSEPELKNKQHSIIVTKGKIEIMTMGSQSIDVLEQGEERLMPAGRQYRIKALNAGTVVYTQYVPGDNEHAVEEKEDIPVQVGSGDVVDMGIEKIPTYKVETGFRENVSSMVVSEHMTVYDTGRLSSIIEDRTHTLLVESGTAVIRVNGKPLMDSDGTTKALFDKKSSIMVNKNKIVDSKGRTWDLTSMKNAVDYEILSESAAPVVIRVQYDKNEGEKEVYAVAPAVLNNRTVIQDAGKINIISPEEMYNMENKGKKDPGSLLWEKAQLRAFVSKNIDIRGYHSSMKDGALEQAAKLYRPGMINELIITQRNLDNYNALVENIGTMHLEDRQKVDKLKIFMDEVKIHVIPSDIDDVDNNGLKNKGWAFAREVNGYALLQAAVTPDMLTKRGTGTVADDLADLMRRRIQSFEWQYMYGMLSREEFRNVDIPEGLEMIRNIQKNDNILDWLNFVNKLLLHMPIQAFNPQDELSQRRKVMWSV